MSRWRSRERREQTWVICWKRAYWASSWGVPGVWASWARAIIEGEISVRRWREYIIWLNQPMRFGKKGGREYVRHSHVGV